MKFKQFIIILIALIIVALLLLFNHYLKINNLLLYATGSKEKALINTTWGMSPKEVERSNKISLAPAKFTYFDLPHQRKGFEYPPVLRMDRYIRLDQVEQITLWGFDTKVVYSFFDNKLFEYTLQVDGYDSMKLHNKVSSALNKRFGNGINEKNDTYLQSMEWETKLIRASYWLLQKGTHSVLAGVEVRYNPLIEKIRRVSLDEQKEIF